MSEVSERFQPCECGQIWNAKTNTWRITWCIGRNRFVSFDAPNVSGGYEVPQWVLEGRDSPDPDPHDTECPDC